MPLIWYSVVNVLPDVRGIAMQLNPFVGVPVRACSSALQRFGAVGVAPNVHAGGVAVLHVTLQLLVPPTLSSGRLPSIIRSIDPELSIKRRTLGSGGLTSSCCARASPRPPTTSATHADAPTSDRPIRILMVAFSSSRTCHGSCDD